jgi:RecA-family ATPase
MDYENEMEFLHNMQVMNDIEEGKHAFTLSELVKMDFDSDVCLLDPILPSVGLVGIVGKPDSGKSMLARELALRVAMGSNEFLGYPLNPQNRRALYIVTEDGLRTSRDVMQRQYLSIMNQIMEERRIAKEEDPSVELPEWHPLDSMNNIEVLPAAALTSKELMDLLERKLEEAAYDVVIIDAIADILSAKDGNSNFQIREGLKPFCSLAEKENLLIMFVGHINKSAYKGSPDQADVQGAAAFAQKARVILDLRADAREPNARYLAVTKGNAVAAEHKKIARRLHWNPETFLSESIMVR